jgi:UDP-N-acetylmuramoyl-L-alanyl-D-glutamate--2,6-diaminopimelate ligase
VSAERAPAQRMGLGELTDVIAPERVVGLPVGAVTGLAYDSRNVTPGTLFFAVPGVHVDGHDFVPEAAQLGALAVVAEHEVPAQTIPQLIVTRARDALADAADTWFGRPSERLRMTGITGTDGKSTTGFLAVAALQAGGRRPGLVGTVALRLGDELRPNDARATTPEALELQAMLAEMLERGNDSAVMEATSHGLAQSRVRNCRFDVAIVTNLTSEHLEFHGTWEAYRAAKAMLVEEAPIAILNADDPSFGFFRDHARDRVLTFGLTDAADVRATAVDARADGTTMTVTTPRWSGELQLQLPGAFNVGNALAAMALAEVEGIDPAAAAVAIGRVEGVPGRMERIDVGQPFAVIVDYAHPADSMEKVLRVLRPLASGRVMVVFGSAGERDPSKRAPMGRVAAQLADVVVVTDEDPRLEDARAINEEIADGARAAGGRDGETLFVIDDRPGAIAHAIGLARPGDVILLAGKGHESNIIYGTERRWWDEAQVARRALLDAGYGDGKTDGDA